MGSAWHGNPHPQMVLIALRLCPWAIHSCMGSWFLHRQWSNIYLAINDRFIQVDRCRVHCNSQLISHISNVCSWSLCSSHWQQLPGYWWSSGLLSGAMRTRTKNRECPNYLAQHCVYVCVCVCACACACACVCVCVRVHELQQTKDMRYKETACPETCWHAW